MEIGAKDMSQELGSFLKRFDASNFEVETECFQCGNMYTIALQTIEEYGEIVHPELLAALVKPKRMQTLMWIIVRRVLTYDSFFRCRNKL